MVACVIGLSVLDWCYHHKGCHHIRRAVIPLVTRRVKYVLFCHRYTLFIDKLPFVYPAKENLNKVFLNYNASQRHHMNVRVPGITGNSGQYVKTKHDDVIKWKHFPYDAITTCSLWTFRICFHNTSKKFLQTFFVIMCSESLIFATKMIVSPKTTVLGISREWILRIIS